MSVSKNILIIDGHPFTESLTSSLASAYASGAQEGGHDVHVLKVADLTFDAVLHKGYREIQALEPDLVRAQEEVVWADHIAVFYPVWWGSMPALLKGFFDRVMLPGFAFSYRSKESHLWDKLLTKKTGRVVVTADAPKWYMRIYAGSSAKQIKRNILQFCGIDPVRITEVTPVKMMSPETIEKHIAAIRALGVKGL
jgi:NAD(P)H dehydrogenase (quinone)